MLEPFGATASFDDEQSMWQKARHGLDSPYHVVEIETYGGDIWCDPEREITITHPDGCSDTASCAFDDFETTSVEGEADGRYFVELKFTQDYWGESDMELIIHGPADA